MTKIVVYTALFGPIDQLWTAGTQNTRHIAFTDRKRDEIDLRTGRKVSDNWEQVVVEPGWDNRRSARHFKTLPQYYAPDADVWVWVDANVRLTISPQELVDTYLHQDFATFKHPDRDCLFVEAAFCAQAKKDRSEVLDRQTAKYERESMPRYWGLAETRIVIRRNTPEVRELNVAWWNEIEEFSLRDQVSLPYVFWKRGLTWEVIPGRCGPVRPSGPWSYQSHLRA
jgi:hypothetical protein